MNQHPDPVSGRAYTYYLREPPSKQLKSSRTPVEMAPTQDLGEIRKWLEAVRFSSHPGSSCSHRALITEFILQWYAVGDKCIPSNSIKWFAEDCIVRTYYSLFDPILASSCSN